jgi:serine/threonine-protein kinase
MGTVYLAERLLGETPQRVALKLIRGIPTSASRDRLARERSLLAGLNHPNIARLIDAGETAAQLPYLAMEYVEGLSLHDYCVQHDLDIGARLRLFEQVCCAVQHAHQRLIVHRDIKPSNILVRDDGTPVLLDFGIGKLLDPMENDATVTQVFTPAYAAPEQRSGYGVTTAADIYGLGCVLHELLSERSMRDVREGESVPPPSAVARDPSRARALRGDLDTMVGKALSAEPEQRYASAGAFADDIDHYLHGQPVSAHSPTRWYRTRKFIQRHRGGVSAVAALTLIVFAALGIALWQANVARQEAVRANTLHDFMVSAFEQAEPGAPRDGPPRITEVVEQAIVNARKDVNMDRAVRSELLSELGAVLRIQGRLQPAKETLQWNYDQTRENYGDDALATLAAGHQLLMTLHQAGDFDAARVLADRLLAAPERDATLRSRLLVDSAQLASKQHEIARALADGHAAVDTARRAADAECLAEATSSFANVQLAANDPAGAIKTYEELLALRERQLGLQHIKVATAHAGASRAYRRVGDYGAAEKHIRAALAIDALVLPKDDWRHANHLNALMMLARTKRDYRAALDAANEGLRINRIAYGNDSPEIANDLANLGKLQLSLENPAAGVPPLREALGLIQAKFGPEHYATAIARADYGMALAQSGDTGAGEAEIHHAIASLEHAAEPDFDAQAMTWESLARLSLDRHDAAAALPSIDRIDALLARISAPAAYWNGRSAALRATALIEQAQAAQAIPLLDVAAAALPKSKDADAVLCVEVPLLRAIAARMLGDTVGVQAFGADGLARLGKLRAPPSRLTWEAATLQLQNNGH